MAVELRGNDATEQFVRCRGDGVERSGRVQTEHFVDGSFDEILTLAICRVD